jgi:hypothetical protein
MSHMWLPAKWSIRWPRLLNHSAFKSSSLNRSVTRMHSSCHPINICHFERCSSEYYVLHNHSPHTNYDKYTSKFHPRYWAYDYRRREERSYIGTFIGTLPPRWLSHSCRLICTALKRYGHLHMPENYNLSTGMVEFVEAPYILCWWQYNNLHYVSTRLRSADSHV